PAADPPPPPDGRRGPSPAPFVRRLLRAVGYPLRLARRRPKLLLLLAVVGAVGSGAGLYAHSGRQGPGGPRGVDERRPGVSAERREESRERLRFCLPVWPRSPEVHLLAAKAARRSGDLDAAEYHLNRCLKLQSGATEAVQLEFLLLRVQSGEVDELAPVLLET